MSTYIKLETSPCKGPDAPTVQQLIDGLMKIEDKTQPVFGYLGEDLEGRTHDIIKIEGLDNDFGDRVDINLTFSK